MRRALAVVFGMLISVAAYGETFNFQNVTGSDYGKIVDNLSADFTHTSVSGASPLGHIFGFEIGLVGGMTRTPEIHRVVHETDSTANVASIPGGELLGVVTFPLGITGELGLIPKVGSSTFKFNSFSVAAKWTVTELVELPLALAVKGQLSSSQFTSDAEIKSGGNTVDTTYKYKSTVTALTVLASKDFYLVEPYLGLGVVQGKGDLDVNGVAAFDPSFTAGNSASATRSSSQILLGAELKLVVFKLGVEYAHLFDTNRFSGKLSFYF
jgi:hypothetical protein